MRIVFIQIRGTIDKDYLKPTKGYAFEIGEPAVKRILRRANPAFDFEVISVLKKDSLDLSRDDRDRIYDACSKADADKIVVTHGTDTMIETARKLSTIRNKVIILTGAMKPEKFCDSDASFNVGTAVGAVNVLSNGTYIAMNGRVYSWNAVKRNLQTGQFAKK